MKEIAPCPWCTDGGRPFLHRVRTPAQSYAIECYKCHARGPSTEIGASCSDKDWVERNNMAKEEATKSWNRLIKPNIVVDPFFI